MTVPNFTAGQVLTAAELDALRSALGMTIPDFVAGQVLTAAELNELVTVANNAIGYGTATGGTGVVTVTIGGVDYAYTSFTSTGTLTVTKAGLFDVLVYGAGGGAGANSDTSAVGASCGGGAGGMLQGLVYLTTNETVTIGAGGTGATVAAVGNASSVGGVISVGGGYGYGANSGERQAASMGGSGGGGGRSFNAAGAGQQGFAG